MRGRCDGASSKTWKAPSAPLRMNAVAAPVPRPRHEHTARLGHDRPRRQVGAAVPGEGGTGTLVVPVRGVREREPEAGVGQEHVFFASERPNSAL